ncbi:hypothetical protein [uncultured Stenotrophomonas sp.]|uniref:type II toxin-antitoxin system RelB family antitoxin n=1 Tax=uncultured Stenotrophomonas sp. TaxID=165438 RepID=UPI0025D9118E|nr:hypothetical protein [uncultured Stenotrophomonas sp.]
MSALRDPLVYEFDSPQAESSYDEWLREKVARSMADPRPAVPHDEVERRMAERIAHLRRWASSN